MINDVIETHIKGRQVCPPHVINDEICFSFFFCAHYTNYNNRLYTKYMMYIVLGLPPLCSQAPTDDEWIVCLEFIMSIRVDFNCSNRVCLERRKKKTREGIRGDRYN